MSELELSKEYLPEGYEIIESEELTDLLREVNSLVMSIVNSPADTIIKGEIESKAYLIGHFPLVLNWYNRSHHD